MRSPVDHTVHHNESNRRPPLLASIGTVLIDTFETPPRSQSLITPESSPSSNEPTHSDLSPSTEPEEHPPAGCRTPTRIQTLPKSSIDTPEPSSSGSPTPQLSFQPSDPSSSSSRDALGGGALYTLIGGRIWLPPSELRTLIDRAPGESLEVEEGLNGFGSEMWEWNEGEGRKMTRARIGYEGDKRWFQPIVKAPRRTIESLRGTSLERSEYLHVSPPFSPEDMAKLLDELDGAAKGEWRWRPKIVFEPSPVSCHSDQREWLERVASGVDVLSPNHEELFSFYSHRQLPFSDPCLRPTIEKLMRHLLEIGIGKRGEGTVAIRCGRMGSCIGTRKRGIRWYSAYFGGEEERRVRDVTGAGNAYLGGYVAGLAATGDAYEAALYATVSASFVVEQVGLPILTPALQTSEERWNDDEPRRRLAELAARVKGGSTM